MDVNCELCNDEIILYGRHRDYFELRNNFFICELCIDKAKARMIKRELEKMIEEKK